MASELIPESNFPLSGKYVRSVIDGFSMDPFKGDDTFKEMSVGIGQNSVVATDSQSAIVIGEYADDHEATQRKEALLATDRAKYYDAPVHLDGIARNVDKQTGEVLMMPDVQRFIDQEFSAMHMIASVDPCALLAIAKTAVAAGVPMVDLYQPKGTDDRSTLGFEYAISPNPKHLTLFSTWEGNIRARGVFRVTKASKARVESVETTPEPQAAVEAPPAPSTNGKKKAAAPAEEPAKAETPPVLPPVDIHARSLRGAYTVPELAILHQTQTVPAVSGNYRDAIHQVLRERNLPGRIVESVQGPTITLYKLEVPPSAPIKKFAALSDDFQLQLGVKSVRIQAPIPGERFIGIEVPNEVPRLVSLLGTCATHAFTGSDHRLLMALGEDIAGRPVYGDLASAPHLLIAGATGSGKSIELAAILSSLLLRNTPRDLRLVLIDPKKVELSLFDDIPHLMCPVITDVKEAPGVLRAIWREMDRRYDLLKEAGVRNLAGYNAKASEADHLPFIVVVIDELADLMLQARAEVETSIQRITQLARAVGIHMIIATQRPSVDVITGVIKANVPTRIALSVASQIDSRVIIDSPGAEDLLGKGDLLWCPMDGGGKSTRVQGAFVSEEEVASICRFWRNQKATVAELATLELAEVLGEGEDDSAEDVLFDETVRWVVERGAASTSMLQRKFSIGFQRASRLLDLMETRGVIGPRDGPRPREVLISAADLAEILGVANV